MRSPSKMGSAESPDAYVRGLTDWRSVCVKSLRAAVRKSGKFEETLKWGHLVYFANGPVLLIRAEKERVLFGFWRGKRLRDLEPRLKASGKYEMATIEIRAGGTVTPAVARRLATKAAALNRKFGDPRQAAAK
jgi:hypothetical protein